MKPRIGKDNLLIIMGVSLPLLVVLLFVLATTVPKLLVAPPQHDFLFTSYVSAYPNVAPVRVNIDVFQGRARARIYRNQGSQITRLFLLDHGTSNLREIPISIPDQAETLENGTEIRIPELEALRLDPSLTAPDGYEFRGPGYRGGGLVPELLGMRRHRRATISRGGAVISLPLDLPHYSVHFLGWVVASGETQ
jgi:hypothetical protein